MARVPIVTGASSGLGRELARLIGAGEGRRVDGVWAAAARRPGRARGRSPRIPSADMKARYVASRIPPLPASIKAGGSRASSRRAKRSSQAAWWGALKTMRRHRRVTGAAAFPTAKATRPHHEALCLKVPMGSQIGSSQLYHPIVI